MNRSTWREMPNSAAQPKMREPDARVDVDVNTKTVTVEAKASEEAFKQLIEAAGYRIEAR
jgi:copper chaperone CopZ